MSTKNNATEKSLKNKAIKIKGKNYVLVSDRVRFLAENYEGKYSISTDYNFFEKQKMWVVKAILTIEGQVYMGLAQEIINDGYINKTSALENAETSAVGRACAMAGIGVLDSIASVDEIKKAKTREIFNTQSKKSQSVEYSEKQMTAKQKSMISELAKKAGFQEEDIQKVLKTIKTADEADKKIKFLLNN